jgi:osmotically-inducible protein OsmY
MRTPRVLAGGAAAALALASGCALTRAPESAGAFVDDAAIASSIRARLVEDGSIDAGAIDVETLHGDVTLSGVAKNRLERQTAEGIAIKVKGVKTVQNNVAVRP